MPWWALLTLRTLHRCIPSGEVGIAVRKEYQGNGYASDALKLLCDYAFGFLFLKQLIVHVAADNEVSLRLFGSCGFVQCGLLKEWWFTGGKFKDVVLMQRIRSGSTESGRG